MGVSYWKCNYLSILNKLSYLKINKKYEWRKEEDEEEENDDEEEEEEEEEEDDDDDDEVEEEEKTYKKIMIKNGWSEEARQLIYQTIKIKGYKLKHLSTRYTDGVFVIIFS